MLKESVKLSENARDEYDFDQQLYGLINSIEVDWKAKLMSPEEMIHTVNDPFIRDSKQNTMFAAMPNRCTGVLDVFAATTNSAQLRIYREYVENNYVERSVYESGPSVSEVVGMQSIMFLATHDQLRAKSLEELSEEFTTLMKSKKIINSVSEFGKTAIVESDISRRVSDEFIKAALEGAYLRMVGADKEKFDQGQIVCWFMNSPSGELTRSRRDHRIKICEGFERVLGGQAVFADELLVESAARDISLKRIARIVDQMRSSFTLDQRAAIDLLDVWVNLTDCRILIIDLESYGIYVNEVTLIEYIRTSLGVDSFMLSELIRSRSSKGPGNVRLVTGGIDDSRTKAYVGSRDVDKGVLGGGDDELSWIRS
jgi:hypothetical protein